MRTPPRAEWWNPVVAAGLLVTVWASMVTAGCGYALAGRGSFLPDYIETISIPMFDNNTTIFEVEQLLTQEVREVFIGRGSYRVSTDESDVDVDALLSGTIRSISISPASFTGDQQVSRYVFTLVASIEFTDLTTDDVLWENPGLVFSDEYEVASGGVEASSFFGQRSNAVERLAGDFAETVVSSILEAF